MRIIIKTALFSFVGLLTLPQIFGQFPPKPWPTYSLDNMPRTDFSCQGKILGGYYADAETQCQMFHVCVKVAGVGIKDFRFLCPNGTAFDQEAQICADWGDVDCEQATLYYSSDNFDLYRLGSGFESKRAPVVEDETPFHLQNAESNDLRRTPQQNYNQNLNRNEESNYNEDTTANSRSTYNSGNKNFAKFRKTTTTTTTTTPEPNYHADRRGDDEIFKGSHSSNFFNNRNNGKEDDLVDIPQKPTPQRNYVTRARPRPQNTFRNNNNNIQTFPQKPSEAPFVQPTTSTTTTTTTTTTFAPPINRFRSSSPNNPPFPQNQANSQTLSLQSSFRTGDSNNYEQKNNGQGFYSSSTTTAPFQQNNYQRSTTQQYIQPTTYNPSHSSFIVPSSTPAYDDFRRYEKASTVAAQQFRQTTHNSFYNAQFEKKASEGYDEIKNQEQQQQYQQPQQYNAFSTERSNTNDFERTFAKPAKRVNIQRQNTFNERSTAVPETAHSIGEQNSFVAPQTPAPAQAPQPRHRRPNRFRGTKTFDRKLLDDLEIDSLQVRPLGSEQEQPSSTSTTTTTERPRSFEQNNYNRFDSFRNTGRQTSAPQNYNTPAANNFNSPTPYNQQTANNFGSSTQNNYNTQNLAFSSPAPNIYNNANNFNTPTSINFNSPAPNNYNAPTPNNVNTQPASNSFNAPQPVSNNFNSPAPNNYNSPKTFGFADEYRPSPSPFSLSVEKPQPKALNVSQPVPNKYPQTPFESLPTFHEAPRGFSLNPPYQSPPQNFPTSKQSNPTTKSIHPKKYDEQSFDTYTPSTSGKKFSTLVPKDQFYPTTFKPATYKKVIAGYDQKLGSSTKFSASSYLPTTSTTASYRSSSLAPEEIDEDDGQYHPELYEKDFVRNKQNTRKQSFEQRRPIEQQTDQEEDDEFLNTAHSLNIAAGANQLRADREKNNNKLSSPSSFRSAVTPTLTTTTTTTRRPPVGPTSSGLKKSGKKNKKGSKDEDTSYDYAYYDSFSGNPQDYEYDLISEFGKTRKN